MHLNKSRGFTLIELVIVIVILGVLSAFALPRFVDLGAEARVSSLEGVAGAMRSASSIVFAACNTDPECDVTEVPANSPQQNSIVMEGQSVTLAFGYPRAMDSGILTAIQIDSGDFVVDGEDQVSSELSLAPVSANDPDTCRISYSEPGAVGERPDITLTTDSC